MPTSIEAQGVTVEEAIQVALNQLGVTRDRVEIEILHHPRGGFLGLGARRAKVRATVREAFLADGEEYDMSSGERIGRGGRRGRRSRRRRGRRGEGRQEPEPPPPQQQQRARDERDTRDVRREPRDNRGRDTRDRDVRDRDTREGRDRESRDRDGRESRDREGREREVRGREGRDRESRDSRDPRRDERPGGEHGRDRGRRGGRGRDAERESVGRAAVGSGAGGQPRGRGEPRRDVAEVEAQAPSRGFPEAIVPPAAPPLPSRSVLAPENEGAARRAMEAAAATDAEETAVLGAPSPELQPKAERLVFELLSRMGFQPRVSSTYDPRDGEVVVRVDAEAEGLLIGRRGQTLDAIEHVVNRMASAGEATAETRIAIDVGGYRDRRRDTLLELADRLKVRALTQGRRIQVSPMSPRDRRILQGVLGGDDSVRTRVLGTGFYRRVVIFPVGLEEESMPLEAEDEGVEASVLGDEETP